jgi:hypothetical protein
MLAANLIAKLNIRSMYENSSIGIIIGNKIKGHSGIKIFKNFKFCVNNPIKKTELQIVIDKYKINTKWLVKAIPNGIKLIILHKKTKLNIRKIKGKYT